MNVFRPLEGVLVVSTALNVPGPVALARLASMGARAVKIEPPARDPLSHHCPGWYDFLTAGIEVDRLDLKTAEGRRRLDDRLSEAAILITAQRPAALTRLGLSWDGLHSRFPRLCHVAIGGYAAPRENEPGHDLTYSAVEGLVGPPQVPRTLVVDLAGAEHVVSAALALQLAGTMDGLGRHADVFLGDVAHAMAAPVRYGLTAPGAVLGGGFAGYRLYRARQGWVAVAALEPHFVARLQDELGGSEPSDERFATMFASRTGAEWEAWGRRHDVPIVAVHEWF